MRIVCGQSPLIPHLHKSRMHEGTGRAKHQSENIAWTNRPRRANGLRRITVHQTPPWGRACSMRHACLVVCQRSKNHRDAEKRRVLNDHRPTSDRTICPDAHVPQHSMSPSRGAQPQSWLVCKLTLCSLCAMRWTTKMRHDVGIVHSAVSACCR